MLLKIHPENPSERKIQQVVQCLENDGIIIYPTDTVYAIGCNLYSPKAIKKISQLKGEKANKMAFSLVCSDLSQLSDYTANFDKSVYKVMRKNLPGAFTFILRATNTVVKLFKTNKKTVGIRIPNNNIPRAIVEALGNPIVTTSLKHEDEILEYMTDPELIYDGYKKIVDIIIDGGIGDNQPSTVIDYSGGDMEIVREGKGELVY